MKSGLYVCKCYWLNSRTKELSVMLKYGYTNNIDTRMYYYNKKATYKLLYFKPCKGFLKEREEYMQEYGHPDIHETWRLNRSEHIEYKRGLFRILYNAVNEVCDFKIVKRKDCKGYDWQ